MDKNSEKLSLKRKIKCKYRDIFPRLEDKLKDELSNYHSVLDLGCGKDSLIKFCDIDYSVGVDLYGPYLEESKLKGIHNEYIKKDIREINFDIGSFEAVIAIDILEHLTKEEGYNLIKKMEKIAEKKILILTPNGFVEQDEFDANPLQKHKSGWSTEELEELGFKVWGIHGWKKLRGLEALPKYKPKLFWEIIAIITQKFTYSHPKRAFHLLAVKNID